MERRRLAESFQDKWFVIEGTIRDIDGSADLLDFRLNIGEVMVTIYFGKSNLSRVSHAVPGFYMKVEAVIHTVHDYDSMTFKKGIPLYLGAGAPEQNDRVT